MLGLSRTAVPARSRLSREAGGLLIVVLLLLPAVGQAAAPNKQPLQALRVAVHVHSDASTGDLSVEDLARRGEQLGLDAIVFTENFSLRYEYGLPPLRRLFRFGISYPSLLDYGVGRYLREVAEAQARHPGILLVPGIEAAPFSYWTGSLLSRNLTLHDTQKNILAFGLTDHAQYMTLPAQGNPDSYQYDWESLVAALVPLAFLAGGAGLVLKRRQAVRLGYSRVGIGPCTVATILLMLGLAGAWAAWPLGRTPYSAYDHRLGYQPYQRFIDEVRDHGGLAFWSMAEVRDSSTHSFGPLGTVAVRTDPHPEALMLTTRHSGFGGLYQEAHHVIDAGGLWDQLIDLHLQGRRADPPVMLGEIAFHSLNQARKDLDQVLSVVLVQTRTTAALLDAFRAGRLYAVERQKKEFALRLDSFQLQCGQSGDIAHMGDSLEARSCGRVGIAARVSTSDGEAHPITVTVLRSGRLIANISGQTPLSVDVSDPTNERDRPTAYRLMVVGGGELIANPIFVRTLFRDAGDAPAQGALRVS